MRWTLLLSSLWTTSSLPFITAQSSPSSSPSSSGELSTIYQRRKSDLAQFPTSVQYSSIQSYLSTQTSNGTWPDVIYTSGCTAQRANWPIQEHWNRIITLAAAWSGLYQGGGSGGNYTGSGELLGAALKGMDWWFANDFTSLDCIASGGVSNGTCPCGTPGLWNTNWFDQVILIPQLASTACLLVYSSGLTDSQKTGCYNIPYRAYALRDQYINGVGYLTGANTINVMQNSVSLACYEGNTTILADAFDRAMAVVTFSDQQAEDGIHPDGSFLQHSGILYNGNYGKDLLNAFIQLEGEAIGTSFAANDTTRTAFATDVQGSEWMTYVDKQTKQEHWDLNVIGRFIAFPTSDLQANADINFNVSKLAVATADFTGSNNLSATISQLKSNGTEKLLGNRAFWASDYMVHRRDEFIITNKMISNRSHNTEYTNSANPYGYHLGQGTLFTYVNGYEYRDIEASWDWDLIPGTTVLLDQPRLNSSYVGVTGKKSYVGVTSDGWVGTSVEDYIDPHDGGIAYRKAWFYLDDSILVTTTGLTLNTSVPGVSGTPVITVLDNRMAARDGGVWVDGSSIDASGGVTTSGSTLHYGGNGYLSYVSPFNLTMFEGNRTGNWSAISTSTKGNVTVPIFSAYTTIPNTTYSYILFPASSKERLVEEMQSPTTTPLEYNGILGAAGAERLSLAFWPTSGKTISVEQQQIGWSASGNFTVTTSDAAVYLFATRDNGDGSQTMVVTVSDPSQSLQDLSFSLVGAGLSCPTADWDTGCQSVAGGVSFQIGMPQGGYAGSSVFRDVLVSA